MPLVCQHLSLPHFSKLSLPRLKFARGKCAHALVSSKLAMPAELWLRITRAFWVIRNSIIIFIIILTNVPRMIFVTITFCNRIGIIYLTFTRSVAWACIFYVSFYRFNNWLKAATSMLVKSALQTLMTWKSPKPYSQCNVTNVVTNINVVSESLSKIDFERVIFKMTVFSQWLQTQNVKSNWPLRKMTIIVALTVSNDAFSLFEVT